MTPDIQAAREAAERLRRIHKGECYLSVYGGGTGWMQNDPNDPYNVDMRIGFGLLLAVLADPTALLPAPKWEEKADPTGHPFWLLATIAGTFYSGQQQTDRRWWSQCFGRVEFHPSLSAAQAACEADFRERIRGAFQETKTAPGA